jgi:uncharacterized protein
MDFDIGFWGYVALVVGGVAAGIINTLAGNGSAITLSIMLFLGLPAGWANATNRIGLVFQTLTAVLSVRKIKGASLLFKETRFLFLPAILGSGMGAWLASRTEDHGLTYFIGFVMIVLLATLFLNPKRWSIETDRSKKKKTPLLAFLFFLIGLYAGFIQMGIGIMMLAALVLYSRYSLVDANIVKLQMALIFGIPSFLVFLFSGKMHWPSGMALAVGQSLGAWIGGRYLLSHPSAGKWIRILLIFILIAAIFSIFGIFDILSQLF